jgi:flagellar assembly factor FliW
MSTTTIESSRFGALQIEREAIIEFPLGLIGLGGSRYALVDRNPGSGFQWLHSLEELTLALPVIDPRRFFSEFAPRVAAEDLEQIGVEELSSAELLVTVRATPDPADITVNLRAPLVVWEGRGYQVINTAPNASLQALLFAPAVDSGQPAVDAA